MDSLLCVDVKHLHDRVLLPLLNSIGYDLHDWVDGRSQVRTAGNYDVMPCRRNDVFTPIRHYVTYVGLLAT